MNKIEKIIITVILVIVAIIFLIATFGKNDSKDVNTNNTNFNETSNIISEDSINEIENETTTENTITNEVEEKREPIIENITEIEPQGTVYESGANHGTTDKKQQAINLVKQKWGEDNTVTFRCDSVTSEGEYIIAVVSTQTASVKNYFRVNLAHETVVIEY